MAAIPTQKQVLAGGAAYRRHGDAIEVARISVGSAGRWQVPKGLVDRGEPTEAAAQREVREAAGLQTELAGLIEKIEYWHSGSTRGGQRQGFHKPVCFYVQKAIGGELSQHDHAVNEARWFAIDDAIERLSLVTEKKVVDKARTLLAECT